MTVEACFLNNLYKEVMIQWGEELWDVEYQSAGEEVFLPTWSNDIGENNSCISGGLELQSTQLAQMDEIIGGNMELDSLSNNLFN